MNEMVRDLAAPEVDSPQLESPKVASLELAGPEVTPAPTLPRYTPLAQALHWVTALLAFAILPIAWVMQAMSRGPQREALVTIHRSLGVTILALIAIRMLWRAGHPAPAASGRHGVFLRVAAEAGHWLLYAIFIVMPVSGYILSAAGGHTVPFFGLVDLPALPDNRALSEAARFVHNTTSWAVYALVATHIGAAAWHVAVFRDGTLERMLPAQDAAGH
ncbi:cytochrome b561 [Rhizobiales bacterium GAS113]|nr:cytochrome b561 [Rhizobiales bacterium GAS113]